MDNGLAFLIGYVIAFAIMIFQPFPFKKRGDNKQMPCGRKRKRGRR
jgi:hypothetical protein